MRPPIRPMLPTLVAQPFNRPGWINEEKYDGIRVLAFGSGNKVQLWSRNLKNITAEFPEIEQCLTRLRGYDFVLDGEIVAFDRNGISRFQLIQRRAMDSNIQSVLAVFDCLEIDSREMMKKPLCDRRNALEAIVPARHPLLLRSRRLCANSEIAFKTAKEKGWEGIIAKDDNSVYEPGKRTRSWLKIKCRRESEFVIGGYTPPAGHRTEFGALLVGLYDGKLLRFTGKVGTGFSKKGLVDLAEKMRPLRTRESSFEAPPDESGVTWIRPMLVAQIAFAEWTKGGMLRQPAFLGLRYDKAPLECLWRERDK